MVIEHVKLTTVHITASPQFAHKHGALKLTFPSLVLKDSYLSHKTNAV